MQNAISRIFRCCLMAGALFFAVGAGSAANACPNCKLANESESSRPRAYMYSILFMIGMPATIFTGFGVSFYRMVRKAQAQAAEGEAESADDSGTPPTV